MLPNIFKNNRVSISVRVTFRLLLTFCVGRIKEVRLISGFKRRSGG